MKTVVYLFGAGVTQSELDSTGWTGKSVLMSVIKGSVNTKALGNPHFKKIMDDLSLVASDIDVEQMISLLDDLAETRLSGMWLRIITVRI